MHGEAIKFAEKICLIEVAYTMANWKRVCSADIKDRVLSQRNEQRSVFHRMTLMYGKDVVLRSLLHDVNTVC